MVSAVFHSPAAVALSPDAPQAPAVPAREPQPAVVAANDHAIKAPREARAPINWTGM